MSFSFLSSVGSLVFHDSTLCSNFLRIDRISDSSVTADESCRARRVRSRTIDQIDNRANTAKSTSHDFGSKEFLGHAVYYVTNPGNKEFYLFHRAPLHYLTASRFSPLSSAIGHSIAARCRGRTAGVCTGFAVRLASSVNPLPPQDEEGWTAKWSIR